MAAEPRWRPKGRTQASDVHDGRAMRQLAVAEDHEGWIARSRVNLTPITAPSIMGLFGFFIATLMVGGWQAGWYGPASATMTIWPFAIVAGGLMQIIAAIASFRARDAVALAVHTVWGAFWVGWGLLQLAVATHLVAAIAIGAYSPAYAFWFIALTCVTGLCMLAAAGRSLLVTLTLAFLTGATALTAAGFYAASGTVVNAAGYLFACSAVVALVTGAAMMFENAYGRTIIPLGRWSRQSNLPGAQATDPIAYPAGPPGVRVGQ